jgi:hypothetical protein
MTYEDRAYESADVKTVIPTALNEWHLKPMEGDGTSRYIVNEKNRRNANKLQQMIELMKLVATEQQLTQLREHPPPVDHMNHEILKYKYTEVTRMVEARTMEYLDRRKGVKPDTENICSTEESQSR